VTGDQITNRVKSLQLLEKLKAEQTLLQISIPGVPETFFSSLLAIKEDDGFLLLDELNTKNAHKLLLIHKKLNVHAKLNGIGIQFSTDLIDHGKESGIFFYKVAFPETVLYFQKRQNYRINIGLGINIPIKMKRDDGSPVYGEIINLSETGAGIILDTPYILQLSEILPYCELRLSDETIISCQLEVRYASMNKKSSQQLIGGKFLGVSGPHQRDIARLVIDLQRDMMKRLPRESS